MTFIVHAAADRERARAQRGSVMPFAVEVTDLADGIVGFLEAPVSPSTLDALDRSVATSATVRPLAVTNESEPTAWNSHRPSPSSPAPAAASAVPRARVRARGARVVVTDIDGDRAASVAAELGDQAVATRCDVTSVDDLQAVRQLALERFGRVDLVMNNVGVLAVGNVEDIPIDAWERIVDINLFSVVRSNCRVPAPG